MKKIFLVIFLALFAYTANAQKRPSLYFHETGQVYKVNDLVTLNGDIYKKIAPTGTAVTPPSASWELVSGDFSITDAEIKTAYENNSNTNAFTDAEKNVLSQQSGINTGDQDLSGKQDVLISGTNIKTINGSSILGFGNLTISGSGGSSYNAISETGDPANGNSNIYIGDHNEATNGWGIQIIQDQRIRLGSIVNGDRPEIELDWSNNHALFQANQFRFQDYNATTSQSGIFEFNSLTDERIYNWPDVSGNVALEADASGFNGNLTTSDNTLQEIAQKVDDLVLGGGSISDGDKGDITVSSSGSVWEVDPASITSTKISNGTITRIDLDTDLQSKSDLGGTSLQPSNIDDTAFSGSWDGVTTDSPSKNAVYDYLTTFAGGTPSWAQYNDGTYTTASRLTVVGGAASVTLPNNASTSITSFLASGEDYYDDTTSKITPDAVGDVYMLRVNLKAESASQDNYLKLELDIGGTQNVILERTLSFPRGTGIEHSFSTTNVIYTLGTFIANGGDLKISSGSNADIWDINYVIVKISSGGSTGDVTQVASVAALRSYTIPPTDRDIFVTDGHTTFGIGSSKYYWDATSVAADDNGSVIKATSITTGRFVLEKSNEVNIEQFGAIADTDTNSTDDGPAYLAAISYIVKEGGGTVIIPNRANRFYISENDTSLQFNLSNVTIRGDSQGRGKIYIDWQNAGTLTQGRGTLIKIGNNTDKFTMENLDILVSEGTLANNFVTAVICQEVGGSWSNLKFDNLKIHSEARPDTQAGNHAISFYRNTLDAADTASGRGLTITNCDIYLTGQSIYGINTLATITDILIDNNTIELTAWQDSNNDAYNAIGLYGDAKNFSITNNTLNGSGHSAIAASMAENGIIAFNRVYNVLVVNEGGIEVEYKGGHGTNLTNPDFQTKSVKVHNNYIENCYFGIMVATRELFNASATAVSPYDVQVTNNSVINSTSIGIVVANNVSGTPDYTNGRIKDVLVDGNYIRAEVGLNGTGIRFYDTDGGKITNNIVLGHTRALMLGRSSTITPTGTFQIIGNKFTANADSVGQIFHIESMAEDAIILMNDNVFDGAGFGARGMQASNMSGSNIYLMAKGNLFKDCLDGILLSNNTGLRGSFIGNMATGCSDRGFEIAMTDGIVTDNISINCVTADQFNGTGITLTGNKDL